MKHLDGMVWVWGMKCGDEHTYLLMGKVQYKELKGLQVAGDSFGIGLSGREYCVGYCHILYVGENL